MPITWPVSSPISAIVLDCPPSTPRNRRMTLLCHLVEQDAFAGGNLGQAPGFRIIAKILADEVVVAHQDVMNPARVYLVDGRAAEAVIGVIRQNRLGIMRHQDPFPIRI